MCSDVQEEDGLVGKEMWICEKIPSAGAQGCDDFSIQ